MRLLDEDFIKDVSLTGDTDETLLNEVDGILESAQLMVDSGILTSEKAAELFKVRKENIHPRNDK